MHHHLNERAGQNMQSDPDLSKFLRALFPRKPNAIVLRFQTEERAKREEKETSIFDSFLDTAVLKWNWYEHSSVEIAIVSNEGLGFWKN